MIALALLLPWLLVALTGWHRRAASLGLVAAPLPLILVGLFPAGPLAVPDLLIGTRFGVDPQARALVLLAGLGWLIAALFAASRTETTPRFALFWQITFAGQTLALLAGDVASFYLGYVTMTLAAYGLVVQAGSAEAWRAGRIYLVMAFAGEALILSGLLLIGARFGNADLARLPALLAAEGAGAAAPLLLAGFAVKLGIVPLHMWLPLAHPVAPVPASAVLSGVIVKAGLLGWLRFLPAEAFGTTDVPADGPADGLIALGMLTAFLGVAAGLGQRRLKTVLAYSTISQMGLVLTAFAATLVTGGDAAVLGVMVLNHGLNKIALFLAAGCAVGTSRPKAVLFALPAVALAGLPLTGGAEAKALLKATLAEGGVAAWSLPLALTSTATLLLMLHAFGLARQDRKEGVGAHPAWLVAVAAGLVVPLAWSVGTGRPLSLSPAALWEGVWPLLLAGVLWTGWRRLIGADRRRRLTVPEGDIVVMLERATRWLRGSLDAAGRALSITRRRPGAVDDRGAWIDRLEATLVQLPVAGTALLAILALVWLLARVG